MFSKKFFLKKSIDDLVKEANDSKELTRSLGAFQLVLLGIGAIIGAGIFVIVGPAASLHAGPAITISFILSGLACACAGLCYAELSSAIPISGSSYTYTYATLGEFPAWLIGGAVALTFILGPSAVASGWSSYLVNFLSDYGVNIPASLTGYTGEIKMLADGSTVKCLINLPAFLISIFLTLVVYRGADASAIVNSIIVAIKMTVLVLFVIVGATKIDPSNWAPFIPQNTGEFGKFGVSGIITGASTVFLAFAGFDAVAAAAQETKNPQRDLPIGILGSLFISIVFYVLVSGVLTGVANYTELGVGDPMRIALSKMDMPLFSTFIKTGAMIGLMSVVLVMIYSAVRIIFTITHDGLLPKNLAVCHKKYRTPHVLTIIVGFVIAILSSMVPIGKLVYLANLGTLVTFMVVCVCTMFLRYKFPHVARTFRCPGMPLVPLLGIILFIQIIVGLPIDTFWYAAIWFGFLTVVYILYGQYNSNLVKSQMLDD